MNAMAERWRRLVKAQQNRLVPTYRINFQLNLAAGAQMSLLAILVCRARLKCILLLLTFLKHGVNFSF